MHRASQRSTDLTLLHKILKNLFALKAKAACPSDCAFGKERSPGPGQNWIMLKTVEYSKKKVYRRNHKSSPGKEKRWDKQTPPCLWVSTEFSSRLQWIKIISWPTLLLPFAPRLSSKTLSAYKSHKPSSHLGFQSFCSWKRETMHEKVEITSSSQPLTAVMCNHFHISVMERRRFLYAFYLWASKCPN